MKTLSMIGKWLHARRWPILYSLFVYGIFTLVYVLHGEAIAVAGYAVLLCVTAGILFGVWDCATFCAELSRLSQTAGKNPLTPLPSPQNAKDVAYGQIIEELEKERIHLEAANDHARRDAQEYYTLWVHQVKTPIAAMDLLLQKEEEPLDHRQLSQLEQELFKIDQYVNMALQYQRLSNLQNDLVLAPYAVKDLVVKAAKGCAPLFIHKGLRLTMQEVSGTVVTDEKWFGFVLEQVFTNAVKYTREGEISVFSPDPQTLVIKDTGCGIPPGDMPQLFERGFTGAVGRSERSSTGIGLYLCRQIMDRLGLSIRIESTVGEGTQVILGLAQDDLLID